MSAASKIAALNDLTRLAQQFRGILGLADELKDLVSLENARETETKALADAKEVHVAMQAKLAALDHDVEDAEHALDTARADLERERGLAADVIAQAHAAADGIVQTAHSAALKIERDAEAKANASVVSHAGLLKEIAELDKRVADGKRELSELTARVTDMQAKHDRLTSGLAALKTAF